MRRALCLCPVFDWIIYDSKISATASDTPADPRRYKNAALARMPSVFCRGIFGKLHRKNILVILAVYFIADIPPVFLGEFIAIG